MLTIDPIVHITLNVDSAATIASVYDVGLILGSSGVITSEDRVQRFTSLLEMSEGGFAESSKEYQAAKKYFGVSPAPAAVMVGMIDEGETPIQALAACLERTSAFYGVYVCEATAQQILDLDAYLTTLNRCVLFYAATGTVTAATADSAPLATLCKRQSRRALGLYADGEDSAAAVMGVAMGLARVHTADAFALCYKALASIQPMDMAKADVDAIEKLNGNVYITRGYSHHLLEHGATASGLRYDEVLYLDMIYGDIQDACLDLITRSATKLPQNDQTSALFINALTTVLMAYANRGVIATGSWDHEAIGSIQQGDVIENGFAILIDSYTEQTAADREARKAMPITILLCLSGGVESVAITLNVKR